MSQPGAELVAAVGEGELAGEELRPGRVPDGSLR